MEVNLDRNLRSKKFWRSVDLGDRPSTYLHRQTAEANQ